MSELVAKVSGDSALYISLNASERSWLIVFESGQHDVGALRGANGRIHSHAGALTQDRRASSNSLTNLAYT